MKVAPVSYSSVGFQKGTSLVRQGKNALAATATAAALLLGGSAKAQNVYTDGYGNQFVSYSDYKELYDEYQDSRATSYREGQELARATRQVYEEQAYEFQEALSSKNKTIGIAALVGSLIGGVIGYNYGSSKKKS